MFSGVYISRTCFLGDDDDDDYDDYDVDDDGD